MIRSIFLSALFIFLIGTTSAQEMMYSLEYNPAVITKYQHSNLKAGQNYEDTTLVTLPFFDDFSKLTVWPSPSLWADNYAFINTDYARNAPTIGVATLDAIDAEGALYPNAGPYQFEADRLTSQPIRLDSIFSPIQRAIRKSDSVYLSFFYQPQGRGSTPSKKDSLILEFHSPVEFDPVFANNDTTYVPRWHTVWSSAGGVQVDTFALQQHSYFKEVVIPIADSSLYFKKGFRFRFRNLASLANSYVPDWQSNGDQWNIDVVYLNTGRSIRDTVIKDVAFADRPPSMLRQYEAMPYNQYRANFVEEMKDSLDIKISNLDNVAQNISYKFDVQQGSQPPFETYSGGSHSLNPYQSVGYSTYQPFARPALDFLYPAFETPESIVFNSTHIITTDPAMSFHGNDTLKYAQIFSNYYAYDDGTAEAGIGLNGSSGSYAVRFKLNEADTLRGIQIYFNQVKSGSENQYIDLVIWKDSFGKPGQVIKLKNEVTPAYSDSLNTYHTYWLDTPYSISADNFPGLIFYAGWQQTSVDNINVGLDKYNDTHQNRFYNVDGSWQMSDELHAGSLMLRPIIGKLHPLSTNSNNSVNSLTVFPNPVSNGWFHCNLPSAWSSVPAGSIVITIFNSAGKQVNNQTYSEKNKVEGLAPSFYIIKLTNTVTSETLTSKLLVQ